MIGLYTNLCVDKKIRAVIEETIPGQLIQQRKQGGTMLSYISGSTVIDYLNRAFGYVWDWKIDKYWIQESQPKFNPKYDKEPQKQAPIAHVLGTLSIPLTSENGECIVVEKQGFGSKVIVGGANEQDSIFKAAATDALKKAASLFGIGAQLYRSQDEQDYFNEVTYEDPWTDDELKKHEGERAYLRDLMTKDNVTPEEIDSAVASWSDGLINSINDLLPDQFTDFVNFVKENMAAA